MKIVRSLVVLLLLASFAAGYPCFVLAADSFRVAPVLDNILAKKEIVLGTAASMPPLNMTMKDGQVAGLEIDLARTIADGLGVKLTIRPIVFSGLIAALEARQVDMILSAMTITPGRNLRVAFVGPYFASGKSILTKKSLVDSLSEVSKINNPDKVLVALKGSTSQLFAEKIFPKAKLLLAEDYDQGIQMVREGKVQAMVADMPICQVATYRYPEAELATLRNPISYEPVGIAVPPNDPLFVNWLQNFLNVLEKDGTMKMMMDKWFGDGSWVKQLK